MLALFTDFGTRGPYLGQLKAVLHHDAPAVPVVDLMSDVPAFDIEAAAHLLPALAPELPTGTVFVCVIDPGVGSADREPVIVEVDGRWFVGPGNGLFALLVRRATRTRAWRITWRPTRLSRTFHGRDLFAPVAAQLARGEPAPGAPISSSLIDPGTSPDDLGAVIYLDGYGNAMTGLRAAVAAGADIEVAGQRLRRADTFSDVAVGEVFWYRNSNGLVELAVNRGSAAERLKLEIGTAVVVRPAGSPTDA